MEQFEVGLAHFYQREFAVAAAIFDRIAKSNPNDRVAVNFRYGSAQLMVRGTTEDWTGITKLDVNWGMEIFLT